MNKKELSIVLHQRGFWLSIITAILIILNQGLGLNVPQNTVMAFAGVMISAILGSHYVAGKAMENASEEKNTVVMPK